MMIDSSIKMPHQKVKRRHLSGQSNAKSEDSTQLYVLFFSLCRHRNTNINASVEEDLRADSGRWSTFEKLRFRRVRWRNDAAY